MCRRWKWRHHLFQSVPVHLCPLLQSVPWRSGSYQDGWPNWQEDRISTDQPTAQQCNCHVTVFSPLDAVGVSEVMSLSPLFIVKQNDNGGDEVNNLSGWKEVNIGSAVSATVAIAAEGQGASWIHPFWNVGTSKIAQSDQLAFLQRKKWGIRAENDMFTVRLLPDINIQHFCSSICESPIIWRATNGFVKVFPPLQPPVCNWQLVHTPG